MIATIGYVGGRQVHDSGTNISSGECSTLMLEGNFLWERSGIRISGVRMKCEMKCHKTLLTFKNVNTRRIGVTDNIETLIVGVSVCSFSLVSFLRRYQRISGIIVASVTSRGAWDNVMKNVKMMCKV